MKKGIYITFGSGAKYIGVNKKIDGQIKTLSSYYEMQRIIVKKYDSNFIRSIAWRLPGGSWGEHYIEALNEIITIVSPETDVFFYIRHKVFDKRNLGFLRRLRKGYPNSKIILEVPTYPYKDELLSDLTLFPFYFKDFFYQRFVKNYIDRVVTHSNNEYIFGIKTIKTRNGIDINSVILHDLDGNICSCDVDKCINLIAVAQFQKSHGYERIIKSLKEYYFNGGKRKVLLHMVGIGSELKLYRKLACEHGLEEKIVFYGEKTGKELEDIYKIADIALGCFGLYKRGIYRISTIKVGEYLAHGLPFVNGCEEAAFDDNENIEFYLNFPNDPSDIDMFKIVDFYDKLYGAYDRITLRNTIRGYAKKMVDISVVMKPIIDYIDS